MKTKFGYTADKWQYWLKPVFSVSKTGYVKVLGAEMYRQADYRYMGYWSRENIPLPTIYGLQSYCRLALKADDVEIDDNMLLKPIWDSEKVPHST